MRAFATVVFDTLTLAATAPARVFAIDAGAPVRAGSEVAAEAGGARR